MADLDIARLADLVETDQDIIDLFDWIRRGGWTWGKREEHEPRLQRDLETLKSSIVCRCKEPWPCPFVRVYETYGGED